MYICSTHLHTDGLPLRLVTLCLFLFSLLNFTCL